MRVHAATALLELLVLEMAEGTMLQWSCGVIFGSTWNCSSIWTCSPQRRRDGFLSPSFGQPNSAAWLPLTYRVCRDSQVLLSRTPQGFDSTTVAPSFHAKSGVHLPSFRKLHVRDSRSFVRNQETGAITSFMKFFDSVGGGGKDNVRFGFGPASTLTSTTCIPATSSRETC